MIRLPMESTYNVRDLGGYYTAGGCITQNNKFLRAGIISGLTDNDINRLLDYGLKTVIDLRSAKEIMEKPNTFVTNAVVRYHHMGLLDDLDEKLVHMNMDTGDFLSGLYIAMLDYCEEKISVVFKIIAASMGGCTLFHCTAGKDRTGTIAALLLDLAGVEPCDIVANYEVTHTYIKPYMTNILNVAPEFQIRIGASDPLSMEIFLAHLYEKYGSAEKYLLKTGVSGKEIENIKNGFIGTL